MNIFYYSGLDPSNPAGLRYDGSLQYQGSAGLCSPASANPLRLSSTPVMAAAPYGPPPPSTAAGGRAMDLVVAPPSTLLSLLAPHVQSTNFCAGAAYRMKTPYMIWPKLFRSRSDRVDKSVRCELCDMVLNSELQARQHFNGKHHLRKMRKLKLNSSSSASEDKSQTDAKRSSCKTTDSSEKKIRMKKRHGKWNGEDADKSITADVPCNGALPAGDDEQAISGDEGIARSRKHPDKADSEHLLLRLEDRTMPLSFERLKDNDLPDNGTNPMDLGGKLTNVNSVEELVPAFSYSSNPSDKEFSSACSSSSYANGALVQSPCESVTCSSLSCTAPNDQCSLLHCNSGMSTSSSASLYDSSLLLDVLSQSSLQSFSHVMSSAASSSFRTSTGLPMTTSPRGDDILSLSATPFAPGTILLPRT